MAADKTNNLTIFLTEIADAIREIKGITTPINPQDFAQLIRDIAIKVVGNISSDNTITLLSNIITNGVYTLKYEDATGNPIDNFSDICTLTVSDNDAVYSDFIEENIPPYLSEYIGVYNADGSRVGYILISDFKPSFGERLYRFGLLSDVHDYDESDAYPSDDFNEALSVFNDKETVEFTCICGDITQNGTEAELRKYKTDVQTYSPNTPVYTTTGNHDCVQGASAINETLWKTYTGQNICFELSKTLSNGKTDHFLFFGMTAWSLGSSGTPYNTTNITWLSNKLESYKNERCFVFTHLFFPDRAGNLGKIYPYYNWLGGTQLTQIQALCDKYLNSIWFSGHSHWKWYLQKYEDNANIYRAYDSTGKPTCGWCVHVPSCASPIDSDYSSTGTSTSLAPTFQTTGRVSRPLESEGAVVDVYENYVDIRGIVFKGEGDSDYVDKYLPVATYRLDTTLLNISSDPSTDTVIYLTDENFARNEYDYTNNGIAYDTSESECPIVEWDDATETLSITFDNHSQKLICHTDDMTATTTAEEIQISCDSVDYYINGNKITTDDTYSEALKGIGFYLTNGYYSCTIPTDEGVYAQYDTTANAPTQNNGCNLQFNISKSKYDTVLSSLSATQKYPITIKMVRPRLIVGAENNGNENWLPDGAIQLTSDKFYLSGSNEGSPTVEDDGDYLVFNFDAIRNRFLFTTSEFTRNVTKVTLYHSGYELSEELNSTALSKVGFNNGSLYSTAYTLESGQRLYYSIDDTGSVNNGAYKIECNVSSSYSGPTPLTVRLYRPYIIIE